MSFFQVGVVFVMVVKTRREGERERQVKNTTIAFLAPSIAGFMLYTPQITIIIDIGSRENHGTLPHSDYFELRG